MNNNTRRYPRTLDEAFKGPSYADPIERPTHAPYPAAFWMALVVGLVVGVLAACGRI